MADEIVTPAAPAPPSLARRIIAFPLTLMLLAILVFAAGSAIAIALLKQLPSHPNSPWLLANAAIIILCLLAVFWPFSRYLDPDTAGLFDRRGWAKELVAGIAAGALIFSLVVAASALLGNYHVIGSSGLDTIWEPIAGAALIPGFTEELFFRGILFRYVEKTAGSWIALALTSAAFGAVHLGNPGATWFSSVCIAIEAGILLGAVYMLTRRLWAAMGLHAAWNFTQGWIFGLPVSGTAGGVGLLNGRLSGPELMTGGAFGLEASLPALVIATAAGIVILVLAIRRGHLVPPMWARKAVSVPAAAPPDAQSHTLPM
jgi:membrane protease YdiL (CAAX protease family)